jgi:plasmid stability protein
MGNITIRNIDDSLLQALEERASAAGRSLEDEARQILAQTVRTNPPEDPKEFWERVKQFRESFGDKVFSDSGEIASEMRRQRSNDVGEP